MKGVTLGLVVLFSFCCAEFSSPSFVNLNSQQSSSNKRDTCVGCYLVNTTQFPAYGVPSGSNAFPSYHERTTLAWYNSVRMDPQHFKSSWMVSLIKDSSASGIFTGSDYPSVGGIPWNLNLNRAARAHCSDRSTCPGAANPHNDCNGTSTSDRLNKFYNGWEGEIYWEYPYLGTITNKTWPFFAVSGWICDGSLYSDGTFQSCAVDKSGSDGHRSIIMTTGSEVGCGTVFSSDGSTVFATCDEGGGQAYTTERVLSGSHVFSHVTANTMFFMANFYSSSETVKSASVIVDGTSNSLSLESGSNSAGTWTSASMTVGSACRKYAFKFTTSTGTYLYPSAGEFNTFGEGSCALDYDSETPPNVNDGRRLFPSISLFLAILLVVFY